jgi:NADP-dependent 3-hydroxy acid dehydrogenase YdfG
VAAGLGAEVIGLGCDVTDPASIAAAVRAREERLGRVTILVNNAGVIQPIGLLHETGPAAWASAITIGLTGAAAAARAVLPGMTASGHGTIVNRSSGAAHRHVLRACGGEAG